MSKTETTAETPADTQWAYHLLAALRKRDNIDRVIQEYARAGFSGTKHDIDHRKMRDDVANSIIALWDEKREAADGKA